MDEPSLELAHLPGTNSVHDQHQTTPNSNGSAPGKLTNFDGAHLAPGQHGADGQQAGSVPVAVPPLGDYYSVLHTLRQAHLLRQSAALSAAVAAAASSSSPSTSTQHNAPAFWPGDTSQCSLASTAGSPRHSQSQPRGGDNNGVVVTATERAPSGNDAPTPPAVAPVDSCCGQEATSSPGGRANNGNGGVNKSDVSMGGQCDLLIMANDENATPPQPRIFMCKLNAALAHGQQIHIVTGNGSAHATSVSQFRPGGAPSTTPMTPLSGGPLPFNGSMLLHPLLRNIAAHVLQQQQQQQHVPVDNTGGFESDGPAPAAPGRNFDAISQPAAGIADGLPCISTMPGNLPTLCADSLDPVARLRLLSSLSTNSSNGGSALPGGTDSTAAAAAATCSSSDTLTLCGGRMSPPAVSSAAAADGDRKASVAALCNGTDEGTAADSREHETIRSLAMCQARHRANSAPHSVLAAMAALAHRQHTAAAAAAAHQQHQQHAGVGGGAQHRRMSTAAPRRDSEQGHSVDGVNLEEIKEFARAFKMKRLSLGLTQTQVGQALSMTEGPAYSQSAICRFEKLDITPKSAQKIKPVLEKWMREIDDQVASGAIQPQPQQSQTQNQLQNQNHRNCSSADDAAAGDIDMGNESESKEQIKTNDDHPDSEQENTNDCDQPCQENRPISDLHSSQPEIDTQPESTSTTLDDNNTHLQPCCNVDEAPLPQEPPLQRHMGAMQHQQQQAVAALLAAAAAAAVAAAAHPTPSSGNPPGDMDPNPGQMGPFGLALQPPDTTSPSGIGRHSMSPSGNNNGGGANDLMSPNLDGAGKKRKRRTSFTPHALDMLNRFFTTNTHPSGGEMTALAESLNYDREVIRVWFCNKRQALKNTIKKMKHSDSSSSAGHGANSICGDEDLQHPMMDEGQNNQIQGTMQMQHQNSGTMPTDLAVTGFMSGGANLDGSDANHVVD